MFYTPHRLRRASTPSLRRRATKSTIHLSRPLHPSVHSKRPRDTPEKKNGASVIDILANSKIRFDSVKRVTQIQNTSLSFAEAKYSTVAAREHTLAPPGRHRPRHSRMRLTARQSTPAIDAAIYRPNSTLYQLQPSFHPQSTEPEPTARARRAGKEFY